ncbi:MAG: alpha/beta hydrolase [Burkholderiales bacterium]|nr:alpha/beta hydrolase [Burkholderiales bacterium]
MNDATVLIVPGLRDAVPEHWQTLLATRLRRLGRQVCEVAPMGRTDLDRAARVAAIEAAATAIAGPIVIVAHSGGCVMLAHWARQTCRAVRGALLAVPPDFERPMPAGYPTVAELDEAGWLPLPRQRLPFRAIVAASRNDPLADFDRVAEMARDWGAGLVDLGQVGHLNPASGYGDWPGADDFIATLAAAD